MKPLSKNFIKGLVKIAEKRTQEEFGDGSLSNFLENDMFDDEDGYFIAADDGKILLAREILDRLEVPFKIEEFDEEFEEN